MPKSNQSSRVGTQRDTTHCGDEGSRQLVTWSLQLGIAILAASGSFAAVEFLFDGGYAVGWMRWLLALIPVLVSIDALRRYIRYLGRIDELQRQIHMQALAVSLGVGIFVGIGADLAEYLLGWLMSAAELSAIMLVTWGVSLLIGNWRYR